MTHAARKNLMESCLQVVCRFEQPVFMVYLVFFSLSHYMHTCIPCAYSLRRYAPRGNTRAREASI